MALAKKVTAFLRTGVRPARRYGRTAPIPRVVTLRTFFERQLLILSGAALLVDYFTFHCIVRFFVGFFIIGLCAVGFTRCLLIHFRADWHNAFI